MGWLQLRLRRELQPQQGWLCLQPSKLSLRQAGVERVGQDGRIHSKVQRHEARPLDWRWTATRWGRHKTEIYVRLHLQHGSEEAEKFGSDSDVNGLFYLAGSAIRRNHLHSHYTGTVQVMKAVGNHLVLTFCEKTELFTIILTRAKNVFRLDVSWHGGGLSWGSFVSDVMVKLIEKIFQNFWYYCDANNFFIKSFSCLRRNLWTTQGLRDFTTSNYPISGNLLMQN